MRRGERVCRRVADGRNHDNRTPSRWLHPAAFTEAPPGYLAAWAANTIQDPGIFAFDMEIHKQFRMPYKESHSVQFRLEAFNVLNHPNWAMPSLNVLSGAVPRPTRHKCASEFRNHQQHPNRDAAVATGAKILVLRKAA
jgi:hypothetical protein